MFAQLGLKATLGLRKSLPHFRLVSTTTEYLGGQRQEETDRKERRKRREQGQNLMRETKRENGRVRYYMHVSV